MKALTLPSLDSSNHLIDEFLSSGAIHYVYQPVINVETSEVLAYEVFVRHSREARSNILLSLPMSPHHRFRLDLHGVNAVSARLDFSGAPLEQYMLNIDAETLLSPNFFSEVKRIVSPENAKKILIEITSRVSVNYDDDDVVYNISSLAEYGFKVGIDGMGTTSSNLPLIVLSGISFMKLDSWLSENIKNNRVAHLVSSLADFSKKADLKVIAKDVETKEQSDMLLDCGVVYQQGFHVSPPDAFERGDADH